MVIKKETTFNSWYIAVSQIIAFNLSYCSAFIESLAQGRWIGCGHYLPPKFDNQRKVSLLKRQMVFTGRQNFLPTVNCLWYNPAVPHLVDCRHSWGAWTLFQNGPHFSILLFACKLMPCNLVQGKIFFLRLRQQGLIFKPTKEE